MALADLLGSTPVATFLERHYRRLPYARQDGCRHLAHLADWAVIERVVADPESDSRASRQGALWDGGRLESVQTARRLVADGYTVCLHHAERHDPALAALATEFRRELAAPVDIHLYCTPAAQPGLGWHYDAEDVFVLQTGGGKEWSLRKNTVNPWPLIETLPRDMRHEREVMPMLRCRLEAGDWLYIPGGYWHRTEAGAEESMSLSVGVMPACAIDVYDYLRRRLLDSLLWRQRLPLSGLAGGLSEAEVARAHQTLFAELGRDLSRLLQDQETVSGFLDDWRSKHGGRAV